MKRSRALWPTTLLLAAASLLACRELRNEPREARTYADVKPLMERACNDCHDEKPAAGFRTTSYLSLVSCTREGAIATEPRNEGAPLVAVLSRKDHRNLLTESERALLIDWISAGAPAFRGTVHPAGIIDPRSDDWHGRLVRQSDWAPIRDPNHEIACGRCHDGAPARPEGVELPAPSATACTTCHTQEQGVLACGTCHGQDDKPYPPRDACFFKDAEADAHGAHVTGSLFRAEPLTCGTCHPAPKEDVFAGKHLNGELDIAFNDEAAGDAPRFDSEEGSCAVSCHAQQGEQSEPSWASGDPVNCQSCHLSPPRNHYPGECSTCHEEMGKTSTSLTPQTLHLNGKTDLGNGNETCGACHGKDATGMPQDVGHRLHASTKLMSPLSCDECHDTPTEPNYPNHMNGVSDVRFAGRAVVREQMPSYDGERRCNAVACHGAALPGHTLEPRWTDPKTEDPLACVGCHGAPPPLPHIQSTSCGSTFCHGSEVGLADSKLVISGSGRARHGDGVLQASGD